MEKGKILKHLNFRCHLFKEIVDSIESVAAISVVSNNRKIFAVSKDTCRSMGRNFKRSNEAQKKKILGGFKVW